MGIEEQIKSINDLQKELRSKMDSQYCHTGYAFDFMAHHIYEYSLKLNHLLHNYSLESRKPQC